MLLRYKQNVTLKKSKREKQPNGVYIEKMEFVNDFKVQIQEITDEISASIYGADITKMVRIKSINNKLETFLKSKLNNSDDNISYYYIYIADIKHKIKAVKDYGIDIEVA